MTFLDLFLASLLAQLTALAIYGLARMVMAMYAWVQEIRDELAIKRLARCGKVRPVDSSTTKNPT